MSDIPNTWNKHSKEQAFKALFAHYYAPLCAYADKFLHDKDASEEIVQELFVKLWENRKRLHIDQLKPYLYSSIYRSALHTIKHQKVREKHQHYEKYKNKHYPSPDEGIIADEMYQAYLQELAQMNDKTKAIFLLSRQEKQTYQSIAETMQVSIKTVEAHISKALQAFRARFESINKSSL